MSNQQGRPGEDPATKLSLLMHAPLDECIQALAEAMGNFPRAIAILERKGYKAPQQEK